MSSNIMSIPPLSARLFRALSPQTLTVKLTQAASLENAAMLGLTLAMVDAKVRMHARAYKQEGFSQKDQEMLAVQERVRQVVSTGLWMGSAAVSYFFLHELFPQKSPLTKFLASNVVSYLPDTFIRPFLTAKISKHFWPQAGSNRVNTEQGIAKDATSRMTSPSQNSPLSFQQINPAIASGASPWGSVYSQHPMHMSSGFSANRLT